MKRLIQSSPKKLALAAAVVLTSAALAVIVIPQQLTVFRGKVVSGNLSSVFTSDNNRLVVMGGPTINGYEAPLDVRFDALCSTDLPSRLVLTLETKANSPGLTQYVDMFEWNSNQWVTLDTREVSMVDTTMNLDIPVCWRFAKPGTGQMKLRYWVANQGPVTIPNWSVGIDQMNWDVDPQ